MSNNITTKKQTLRTLSFILVLSLLISSLTGIATASAEVSTPVNGIVKGSDLPDEEAGFETTLSTGEKVSLKILNSELTIKVDATEFGFKIGNITKAADAAVVTEEDALLHILTLGGVYYVFDLYTGVQIVAYRNIGNGMYCSSRNGNAYMVKGKSLINNKYFYELLTSNSVVREKLMTRAEFDLIVGGGDPSLPTPAPTEAPTPEPTATPTPAPTEAPTPTATPNVVIKLDFEFWWERYLSGTITWEQLTEVLYQHQWKVDTVTTEKEVTLYFYDDKGNLIRTEREMISSGKEEGAGKVEGTVTQKGEAQVAITETGKGEVTGTITVTQTAPTEAPKAKAKKAKAKARVVTSGKRIKLFSKKNKLHSWLEFNPKTGVLNYNGYKMKGVVSAGFIKGSWNVIVLKKNGKVYKLPRSVKKGKTLHKTRIKTGKEKGIALNRNSYGFVYKIKLTCGGVKNVVDK